MSKVISFAYTSAPLVHLAKSVTRREWSADYAQRFHTGELIHAYDRQPRFRGSHIADVRLVCRPKLEPLAWMPDSDYEAEGFAWLAKHREAWPKTIWGRPIRDGDFSFEWFREWRSSPESMWVVRFKVVRVVDRRALPPTKEMPLFAAAGVWSPGP